MSWGLHNHAPRSAEIGRWWGSAKQGPARYGLWPAGGTWERTAKAVWSGELDVFDMFGPDDPSDRTALATAPERESTGNYADGRGDRPGQRQGGRWVLVLVVVGVLVAGLIGAVGWVLSRSLASDEDVVSCSAQDRADQEKLLNWLQLHTDAGLAGQVREVAGIGCAPGQASPGAWVAVVDADELRGMTAALADSGCELTGTDPTTSPKGKQTCPVDVEGLNATVEVRNAQRDSPYGDYEVTIVRGSAPPAA